MRNEDVRCDNCGAQKPTRPERPKTWWVLEDQGAVMRTRACDFCSLACLTAWLTDDDVRAIYEVDFVRPAPSTPPRYRSAFRLFRRWRLWRWILQLQVMRS